LESEGFDAGCANLACLGEVELFWFFTLKTVRAHFGEWKAVNVTSDAIDQFIEAQLEKEYKPATVNRSTQLLGQAFNLAVQKNKISAAPYIVSVRL
jgi:hypothetical protein